MISMLSQMSSSQDKKTAFRPERPRPSEGHAGLMTLCAISLSVAIAVLTATGTHGTVQNPGMVKEAVAKPVMPAGRV